VRPQHWWALQQEPALPPRAPARALHSQSRERRQ
jgi:hypothetical protein